MRRGGAATPLIVVAAFVPLLVFGALQVASQLQSRTREEIESTLGRADAVNLKVDAIILSDQSALAVLATSRTFEGDPEGARRRALDLAEERPQWRNLVLTERATGEVIWETRDGAARARRASVDAYLASDRREPIGNIYDHAPECVCISLHHPVDVNGAELYVLTLERSTDDLQATLMASLKPTEVAAIVDRRGHFIARSVDYEAKLGTPATRYVRDAIKGGNEGIYAGVTYEGFKNRTGFYTSAVTGWSTHIAVPPATFTMFEAGSVGFTVFAAFLALAFAAAFVWFAIRNVRLQRLAEERNTQAQKLEALGQLTGGVAHDFNNFLAIIISGLSLIQRKLARGDYDVGKYIEGAIDSAQRASALTQRLLSFSRQQSVAPAPTNANHVISTMIELLARTLGKEIQVRTQLAEGLWLTFLDAPLLEGAVLNLAVNGRDAMPGGGVLTISTRNAAAGNEQAKSDGIPSGDYVLVSVADTGHGMDAETLSHALEPFYTTKPDGKGTGLGLSQVLGFVEQSSGHLRFRSRVGSGTEVRLYFPRYNGELKKAGSASNGDAPRAKRDELILLVEDEDQVRENAAASLRELGYTALAVGSGREALHLINARSDISLLFTDIVMPGMNGRDLADAARRDRPGLKVLFMTGYDPAAGGKAASAGDVLAKPFSLEQLAVKVRSALDG